MIEHTENPYIKVSHIPMSLDGFIELLKAQWYPKRVGSSYKKTGPFSWEEPYGRNSVRALYLGKVSRVSRDSRMCKIYEHICWHPTLRLVLPWRSKHVMTLHMTRIEGESLYVELVCRDPRVKDTMFRHFAAEMERLEEQYAKSGQMTARGSTHTQEGEWHGPGQGMPPANAPSPDHEPWNEIPDHRWDRHALQLWWKGYEASQISDRLHVSAKTIRNRLSDLRQIYSEEIVPTADQLREMGFR